MKINPREVCDVIVDLETLGRRAGCPVLEIGAAATLGDGSIVTFQAFPHLQPQLEVLKPDAATILWWMGEAQTPARQALLAKVGPEGESAQPVELALDGFSKFVNEVSYGRDLRIWGNSARFDLGILEELYRLWARDLPWLFWQERDLRTAFDGNTPNVTFDGIKHVGRDDAKHELRQLLWLERAQ